jgi:hypothetical protein
LTIEIAKRLVEAGSAILLVVLDHGDIAILSGFITFFTTVGYNNRIWAVGQHLEAAAGIASSIQPVWLVTVAVRVDRPRRREVADWHLGPSIATEVRYRDSNCLITRLGILLECLSFLTTYSYPYETTKNRS